MYIFLRKYNYRKLYLHSYQLSAITNSISIVLYVRPKSSSNSIYTVSFTSWRLLLQNTQIKLHTHMYLMTRPHTDQCSWELHISNSSITGSFNYTMISELTLTTPLLQEERAIYRVVEANFPCYCKLNVGWSGNSYIDINYCLTKTYITSTYPGQPC